MSKPWALLRLAGASMAGMPVYRTGERGVVDVVSDGTRVWVETER